MKDKIRRSVVQEPDVFVAPAWPALMRKVGIAVLALGLCWSIGFAADSPALPPGLSAPAKPTAVPAFDLPTVDGSTFRSESLKGQVIIVRYWASW